MEMINNCFATMVNGSTSQWGYDAFHPVVERGTLLFCDKFFSNRPYPTAAGLKVFRTTPQAPGGHKYCFYGHQVPGSLALHYWVLTQLWGLGARVCGGEVPRLQKDRVPPSQMRNYFLKMFKQRKPDTSLKTKENKYWTALRTGKWVFRKTC